MPFQRIGFTLDEIFTRGVEVELLEFKRGAIELQGATRGITDLHGVTVVDHCVATRLIVEYQRGQFGLDQSAQVNRRLIAARTLTKLRGQLGPVGRSRLTAIFPMGVAANTTGHSNREQANRDFLIIHPYLD